MDTNAFGEFLATLRKEQKMTQAVLAEKLNISNRTISKWENGDGYPDITILPALAEIFGITVDELLKGERLPKDEADIKVTEIENKDNLKNLFQISYIISLFFAVFGAILGTVTLAYSTWAFNILFYTHWEIIFVAMSFCAMIVSGLSFAIGTTRLKVSYSIDEIKSMTAKKAWLISLLIASLPSAFIVRLVDCSHRIGDMTEFALIIVFAIDIIAFALLWLKIRKNTH